MKQILYIVLGVVAFVLLLTGVFYHMLVVSPAKYEEEQNNYFSKIDYDFSGTVNKFQYLGGVYALIYIKPSSFQIKKNMIKRSDDFTGSYSKKDDLIILFANFDLVMNDRYNSLEKDKLEDVNVDIKVNSIKQKIYYYKNKKLVGETYLVPASVYVKKLIMLEKDMNEPIRF